VNKMLIESGDLIPVVRDAIEIPWTKRKMQILSYLFKGPVNFETYVYDTNVGDIAQLSTYFNPEKWTESDLNGKFANQSTIDEITIATANSQGPNTTNASISPNVSGLPESTSTSATKIKSSSLLPRLMVLAPGYKPLDSANQGPEEVNEDCWSSIRSSSPRLAAVSPLLDTSDTFPTCKKRNESGIIQGSEKLNEKVFLNCGDNKRSTPNHDLLFNLEIIKKLQNVVSPANSCSSRSSSRAGSRPVSRQSSLSCGSGRTTPAQLSRASSLCRPDRRLSNCTDDLACGDTAMVEGTVQRDHQKVPLPKGLAFLLERRNSGGHNPCTPPPPPPVFDPAQPPPSMRPPTRMTFSSGLNSPRAFSFSTPPPGYSGTGIPKLDLAVNKIGDGKPDRILAPWTVAGSEGNDPKISKKRPVPASLEAIRGDDEPIDDIIPLFEVATDNVVDLALTDDADALRAKGVRMKRVRPLMEHVTVRDQISNAADLLDLPPSNYFTIDSWLENDATSSLEK